jgi:hypothetical protein
MNQQGNWGTFVDPADIPANLQHSIMGGMYGSPGNWDTSNPSITGPQQWGTGKYQHSGGGGGTPQPESQSRSAYNDAAAQEALAQAAKAQASTPVTFKNYFG